MALKEEQDCTAAHISFDEYVAKLTQWLRTDKSSWPLAKRRINGEKVTISELDDNICRASFLGGGLVTLKHGPQTPLKPSPTHALRQPTRHLMLRVGRGGNRKGSASPH